VPDAGEGAEAAAEAAQAEHDAAEEGGQGQSCPKEWPAPLRALTAISRVLAVLEGLGIIVCLVSVIGLATWQFVERNLTQHHVPFVHVPAWADGLIRHSVFLLGYLGGAYAAFANRHIRIDAVTRVATVRRRLVLRVVTTIAALVIVSIFTKAAYGVYLNNLQENSDPSQADQFFTSARGAMIMLYGYAVIAFHFLVQIALDLGWLISKKDPPASYIAEASAH
jgi:TRAP-type C4-dicarboxylate transport system permease small subunit